MKENLDAIRADLSTRIKYECGLGPAPSRPAPAEDTDPSSVDVPMLWRCDGVRFSRNEDGTYSMDSSNMAKPHRWTYEYLMSTRHFSHTEPNVNPPMSYERFRELWKDAGFTPHLSAALVKAANGDYSDFDKIERFLENAK